MIDEIIEQVKEVTAWNFDQSEKEITRLYESNRNLARSKARLLKSFAELHKVVMAEKNYQSR